jgi:hypothetical protein
LREEADNITESAQLEENFCRCQPTFSVVNSVLLRPLPYHDSDLSLPFSRYPKHEERRNFYLNLLQRVGTVPVAPQRLTAVLVGFFAGFVLLVGGDWTAWRDGLRG